ncbi:hypothetical protein T06_14425 [Trichinella sp. T6]|nr:hypothetical protein T06_14425 [Trichinella sp. T6]
MAELMSMSDVDHQVVEKQPVDRKAFSPEDVAEMLVAQAGKQKIVRFAFHPWIGKLMSKYYDKQQFAKLSSKSSSQVAIAELFFFA